jgi:hypothetical protein
MNFKKSLPLSPQQKAKILELAPNTPQYVIAREVGGSIHYVKRYYEEKGLVPFKPAPKGKNRHKPKKKFVFERPFVEDKPKTIVRHKADHTNPDYSKLYAD